ncbi:hypothetical protein [Variovorax paradoxus]|uniref:hypothetical protein n=1 Tax=Variovorax paradoxus TaxID=34073 RepID=UPI002781B091|nr:hypothetical protein [Variovorax paradoxus]MDQ0587773.1 hypothetical protein [Variovorax paradoxus]
MSAARVVPVPGARALVLGWAVLGLVGSWLFVGSSAVTHTVIAMLAWHGVVLALPFIAAVLEALHRGVDDPILLALWGGAVSSICAYLSFWCLFFDPVFAPVLLISALISAAVVVWRSSIRLTSLQRRICKELLTPFGLCLAYTAVLLIVAIAPSGAIDQPLEVARSRFSHALPMDNALPFLFSKNVLANNYPSPMFGDWLGSDRPPLQSGYFLFSTLGIGQLPWFRPHEELSYQVQGTLLQSFWLAGLWILLNSMKLRRSAVIGAMAACAISGFAFVHGIFVWPKLLPVFFLSLIAGFVFSSDRSQLSGARTGALLGCGAALTLLSHGGSFFAIAGLVIYALMAWKIPTARFLIAAILAGAATLLPWSLFQNYFDPPGDRLLKWHLAGVVNIDGRSFATALKDAYRGMTFRGFFSAKLDGISAVVGVLREWPWLQFKTLVLQISVPEVLRLRASQFYNLMATLGFFAWAPFLFLFARRDASNAQMIAAKRLLGLSMLIVAVWIFAMYEPGSTVIHQGSLAMVAFALAGSFLFCFAWWPLFAWLLLFCHLMVSVFLYFLPIKEEGLPSFGYFSMPIFDDAFALFLLLVAAFFVMRWGMNGSQSAVRAPP